MRTGRTSYVDSSVDENPAGCSFGKHRCRTRQFEEGAVREILLPDLHKIHPPFDRSSDVVGERRAGQLLPVCDVAKQRSLNGEKSRRSLS